LGDGTGPLCRASAAGFIALFAAGAEVAQRRQPFRAPRVAHFLHGRRHSATEQADETDQNNHEP